MSNTLGSAVGRGNIISANPQDGVLVTGEQATGNRIIGNFIGTDHTGTLALPNGLNGVTVVERAHDNEIGGVRPPRHDPTSPSIILPPAPDQLGAGNLISANQFGGIRLTGNGVVENAVWGNLIGYSFGTNRLGNGGDGVTLSEGAASSCLGNCLAVAGLNPGRANWITRNAGAGVLVVGATTSGHSISQNLVHDNAGANVLLVDGANGGVRPPLITSYQPATGRVVGNAPGQGIVEIFSAEDGAYTLSAFVEGGAFTVDPLNPSASVNAFVFDSPRPLRPGSIRGTFTDFDTGNTSEFANADSGALQGPPGQLARSLHNHRAEPHPPQIRVVPPNDGVAPGQAAFVEIRGAELPEVSAVLFDLFFEPTKLALEDLSLPPALTDPAVFAMNLDQLPNSSGTVRVGAVFPRGRSADSALLRSQFRARLDSPEGPTVLTLRPLAAVDVQLQALTLEGIEGTLSLLAGPADSPFRRWQLANWPPDTAEAIQGPDADPDGDDIPNLMEYALNLDPEVPARTGLPELVFVSVEGQPFGALRFTRVPGATDLDYRVLAAASLAAPIWQPLTAAPDVTLGGDVEIHTSRDSRPVADFAQRYFQLQVSLQP